MLPLLDAVDDLLPATAAAPILPIPDLDTDTLGGLGVVESRVNGFRLGVGGPRREAVEDLRPPDLVKRLGAAVVAAAVAAAEVAGDFPRKCVLVFEAVGEACASRTRSFGRLPPRRSLVDPPAPAALLAAGRAVAARLG